LHSGEKEKVEVVEEERKGKNIGMKKKGKKTNLEHEDVGAVVEDSQHGLALLLEREAAFLGLEWRVEVRTRGGGGRESRENELKMRPMKPKERGREFFFFFFLSLSAERATGGAGARIRSLATSRVSRCYPSCSRTRGRETHHGCCWRGGGRNARRRKKERTRC